MKKRHPEIFIGSYMVEPRDFKCPIRILNTTENEVEIKMPYVTIDDIQTEKYENLQIVTVMRYNVKLEISPLHKERIKTLLQTEIYEEENRVLMNICEEYSDVFHLEGDQLTYTEIKHEINVKVDSSSVNVRSYRLPEKHKA